MSKIMDEIGRDYAKEAILNTALKLIIRGKDSIEEIAELTNLTVEEVQSIANQLSSITA